MKMRVGVNLLIYFGGDLPVNLTPNKIKNKNKEILFFFLAVESSVVPLFFLFSAEKL